jgi:squalene-hopene/tetraprenyl-beta-curcumene cyclase
MIRKRVGFSLVVWLLATVLFSTRCRSQLSGLPISDPQQGEPGLLPQIDASMALAARFLVEAQSADGAWRSNTYGCFRDGASLTPLVLSSIFFLPHGGEAARESFGRGVEYLLDMIEEDRAIRTGPYGLNFPVYTAAMASRVVVLEAKTERNLQAQTAFLAYVRERQLTEALGWKPSDLEYGGWGFSLGIPTKPGPGELRERFFESNLSATIFGLAALKSARVPLDDPAYAQALIFLERCQNYSEKLEDRDPGFDDGGFFFIPGDSLQNKAGVAGEDRFGRERFHSYGSMTADGLRALVSCGLPHDHPRVVAARKWLERNFSAGTHPGTFNADREVLREATYYYYCWAIAHAFLALNLPQIDTPTGKVNWAEALAKELVSRQESDGSWVNRLTDAKEDDPLVAVPWAASTLAICRRMIEGGFLTPDGKCPTQRPQADSVPMLNS